MENILIFIVALAAVCIVAKLLSAPIKLIIKILVNALIGGIVLYVLQWLGLPVSVNFLTALIVGALGVPGVIICLILGMFF